MHKGEASFIIKLEQSTKQLSDVGLVKFLGVLAPKSIVELAANITLDANPRRARLNKVTEAIIETLSNSPDMMQFKSKGLLVSCRVEPLERNRFRILFDGSGIDGLIDGGHNMLAILRYIIEKTLDFKNLFDKELRMRFRKADSWDKIRDLWPEVVSDVREVVLLAEEAKERKDQGDVISSEKENLIEAMAFRVPIELVTPGGNLGDLDFKELVHSISEGRNNNVELTKATIANQKGLFEILKASLNPVVSDQVEWKSGDTTGRPIKSQDVVALSLIPLFLLQKEGLLSGENDKWKDVPQINLVQIYSGKTSCVTIYEKIFSILEESEDEPVSSRIKKSLGVMKDLPGLADLWTVNFQKWYNTNGSYGRIKCVTEKQHKRDKLCKFTTASFTKDAYDCPDGFVTPLIAAMHAFMEYSVGADAIVWRVPVAKIQKIISEVGNPALKDAFAFYTGYMKDLAYDPQKIGKSSTAYSSLGNYFSQIK